MDINTLFCGIEYEQKGESKEILSLQKKSSDIVNSGLFFAIKGLILMVKTALWTLSKMVV